MQLLALVTMEPPVDLSADAIHAEKIKVLNSIRLLSKDSIDSDVVRGQYGPGVIDGGEVRGYKQEPGVAPTSQSETFVAIRLFIDNARWAGVPFYIRGGKRLPKRATEIAVTFKTAQHGMASQPPNVLFISVQPNSGVYLKTISKEPSLDNSVKAVLVGYRLESINTRHCPDAYERLLYDTLIGDRSLFVEGEEQLAAWRLLTPVLERWQSQTEAEVASYQSGTWGPEASEGLLRRNGHQWQILEEWKGNQ
jgi:glucose-6-phosphate 1-dehydrogenase